MEKLEYFDSVREFWNRQFCTFEICKKLVELGFNEICLNRSDSDPDVLAILWQQAIDWIREKYDIHIVITVYPYSEIIEVNGYKIYAEINGSLCTAVSEETQCWSYYKAREQAILKSIEIIETK